MIKRKLSLKKGLAFITATFIIVLVTGVFRVYAREGDSGYEGAQRAPGKTSFEYKEVCL